MNRHFSDAQYHLGRTASHLATGLREELSPAIGRIRSRLGYEVEPAEPETRAERVRKSAVRAKHRVVTVGVRAKQRIRPTRTDDESTA